MDVSKLKIKKNTRLCEKDIVAEGSLQTKRLMCFLFTSSRGGIRRMKIVLALKRKPMNRHKLSQELGIEYKSLQHHMNVLKKHGILEVSGDRYGRTFFLSSLLITNIAVFNEIVRKMNHYF